MKLTLRTALLAVVTFVALGASCCDPQHDAWAVGEASVAECRNHGGVAVTAPVNDDGGHTFTTLKQCAFPQGQVIAVEKP